MHSELQRGRIALKSYVKMSTNDIGKIEDELHVDVKRDLNDVLESIPLGEEGVELFTYFYFLLLLSDERRVLNNSLTFTSCCC